MKLSFFAKLAFFVFIISCGQNKAKYQQQAVNEIREKKADNKLKPGEPGPQLTAASAADANSSLMGEWDQQYAVLDQNGNAILDLEEHKDTRSTMGFNYFKFNDEGSCLYDSDMKFRGTYEILEGNGKRKLYVTVNGFGETHKYSIVDPVTDELILYSPGAFMIVKKK